MKVSSFIQTPAKSTKSAKDYFLEFQGQTGIKAFAFLKSSVCPLERFLWGIVLAITIALTINDITNTFKKYFAEPTVTNVEVKRNHSFTLHDPVLCVQYDSETMETTIDIDDENLLRQILSVLDDKTDIIGYFESELYRMRNISEAQDYTEAYLRKTPDLSVLVPDKKFWNLLYVTQRMLSYIIRAENWIRGHKSTEIEATSIEKIFRYFHQKGTSFEKLWKTVGALMCQISDLIIIKIRHDRHNGTITHDVNLPCIPHQVTWLGGSPFDNSAIEKVCVKLGGDSFYYKIRDDHNLITLSPQNLLSDTGLNEKVRRRLKVTVDFEADRVTTTMSQNLLEILSTNQVVATTTVLGHFKSLSTRHHECSSHLKYLDCRSLCRAEYIENNCGCWALSWVDLFKSHKHRQMPQLCPGIQEKEVPKLHYFHFQRNSPSCEQLFSSYDPDMVCYKECYENCEQWILSFRYSQFTEPIGDDNLTMIDLFVDPFSFPQFDVSLAFEGRAVLAALGGNLSFWIGASLLALLHVIVFICRMPFDCYSARRHSAKQAGQDKNALELGAKK